MKILKLTIPASQKLANKNARKISILSDRIICYYESALNDNETVIQIEDRSVNTAHKFICCINVIESVEMIDRMMMEE